MGPLSSCARACELPLSPPRQQQCSHLCRCRPAPPPAGAAAGGCAPPAPPHAAPAAPPARGRPPAGAGCPPAGDAAQPPPPPALEAAGAVQRCGAPSPRRRQGKEACCGANACKMKLLRLGSGNATSPYVLTHPPGDPPTCQSHGPRVAPPLPPAALAAAGTGL